MVSSAALLFRERGYSGTGFRDVIDHSGAPRGSIYHHFPDGKAQLAEETVRWAGEVIAHQLDRATRAGDPIAALRTFVAGWREVLEGSDFRAGCPVVAVAVEADAGDEALAAAGDAFAEWERLIAKMLRDAGVSRAESARLATLTVAATEGAIVLCRARGNIRPLTTVARELETTIKAAHPSDGSPRAQASPPRTAARTRPASG